MRVFQNAGLYPAYRQRLKSLTSDAQTHGQALEAVLADRYGATHLLKPVLDGDPCAFFTNADDEFLQARWATEHHLKNATLEKILLAQIEHHRAEVFYNQDPMRFQTDFLKKLPGCVKRTVAWRAAPFSGADLSGYDLVVCNFPSILERFRKEGWRAAYFAPSYDPVMGDFAGNDQRPIDILFVGGYSRHHRNRAEMLEAVANLGGEYKVVFHLDRSRLTRVSELPGLGWFPLSKHQRPKPIRRVCQGPIFGLDLYRVLSSSKIVLNGAIDMAGSDRGNMRCFEALGCGALLVSDQGSYPDGMENGKTLLTYESPQDAVFRLREALAEPRRHQHIAAEGHHMIRTLYSKERHWAAFQNMISSLS